MASVLPASVTFPGQEIIPGLRAGLGRAEPAFLVLEGNCPIIISAPHAGTRATTPAGATTFGERRLLNPDPEHPLKGLQDDTNTLPIAFALVRTLASLGFVPHAAINLVSRRYMDLNRTWSGQQSWVGPGGTRLPEDEALPVAEFPRVAEFRTFRRFFHQDYHDALDRFTTSQHPDGWLFDIHGNDLTGFGTGRTLQVVTSLGFTARRDFVYDNPVNLHRLLAEGGFALDPQAADPGAESAKVTANGNVSMNLISGNLHGAQAPPARRADLPEPGPVAAGPQPLRVHGVQFEMDGTIRVDRTAEQLETVGINLALAIYRCLRANGVLQRTANPRAGRHAVPAYTLFG